MVGHDRLALDFCRYIDVIDKLSTSFYTVRTPVFEEPL